VPAHRADDLTERQAESARTGAVVPAELAIAYGQIVYRMLVQAIMRDEPLVQGRERARTPWSSLAASLVRIRSDLPMRLASSTRAATEKRLDSGRRATSQAGAAPDHPHPGARCCTADAQFATRPA
jgi:hypothetical protein